MSVEFIKSLLAHPLTRGLALDDPRTTEIRQRIIKEKKFLRQFYEEIYARLLAEIPSGEDDGILELGSGGGFLKEMFPRVTTSECFPVRGVDLIVDAAALPFANQSLRGIVMFDVLHHLPQPNYFFAEVARSLMGGGKLVMVEPWHTPFANFIWRHFHHEPFVPEAAEWSLENIAQLSGLKNNAPLSLANTALPWIIFQRDREKFEQKFPELRIEKITLDYPLTYLLSGGVAMRSFLPGFAFAPLRWLEKKLVKILPNFALFALIVIRKS